MESAKLTSKGQITIPKSVRDQLNLKEGDHVLFIQDSNNRMIMTKSEVHAVQQFFDGMVAESRARYYTEAELQDELKKVRKELMDDTSRS